METSRPLREAELGQNLPHPENNEDNAARPIEGTTSSERVHRAG